MGGTARLRAVTWPAILTGSAHRRSQMKSSVMAWWLLAKRKAVNSHRILGTEMSFLPAQWHCSPFPRTSIFISPMDPSCTTGLQPFPRLPPELRWEIWHLAPDTTVQKIDPSVSIFFPRIEAKNWTVFETGNATMLVTSKGGLPDCAGILNHTRFQPGYRHPLRPFDKIHRVHEPLLPNDRHRSSD